MPNQFGVPEISVQEVVSKREANESFILLDVREAHELQIANLGDGILHVPLSQIAHQREGAFSEEFAQDKDAEIVVFCHHGARSAQVAAFLRQEGWTNVLNMNGGIDAYSIAVDSSIRRY
ncbi:MAG: rhodanese-like domain-containing protein [Chloroflexota bacterium]